ncbi:phosphotransferase enzyme family protein [Deinococcus malanensis]|uniref:phosphotransferase enzyme family protein n=1 Tax=Deinococcus malanensis TaxID=1706855 RepID=UPI00363434E2
MNEAGATFTEGLETLWSVGPVRQITAVCGGSINGAYRVQTRDGTYHLRVYRTPDRTQIDREHAAIAVALASGVPTPALLPAHDGNTVARLHGTGADGAWAALFAQAAGAPIPRSALCMKTASALGAFLAQVHSRLPAEVPFAVPVLCASSVEHTAQRLERIEQAILSLPVLEEIDRWALTRTRQRLAHLRSVPLRDVVPSFPFRFLHGDYHDGNVFFRTGSLHHLLTGSRPGVGPGPGRLSGPLT